MGAVVMARPTDQALAAPVEGFDPSRVYGWLLSMTRQGEDHIWRGAEEALRYLNWLTERNDFWKRRADGNREQARINYDSYLSLWAEHGGPQLPPRLRDSDGSPKGGDGTAPCASTTARAEGIAEPIPAPSPDRPSDIRKEGAVSPTRDERA